MNHNPTNIVETLEDLSKLIMDLGQELIKLIIRKSVKYSCYFNLSHIDNYKYTLSTENIGWTDDIMVSFHSSFKALPKDIPRRVRMPFKQSDVIQFTAPGNAFRYRSFTNSIYSPGSTDFLSTVLDGTGSHRYIINIPYFDSFLPLQEIGADIISEITSPVEFDAKVSSTAYLRIKLYSLELALSNFSLKYPDLFIEYVKMIMMVNRVHQGNMHALTALFSELSYQSWLELPPSARAAAVTTLGSEFMDTFMTNNIISIALDTGTPELMLTNAYLYAIMKMLFFVFGFNRLSFDINSSNSNENRICNTTIIMKFYELYPTIVGIMGGIKNLFPIVENCSTVSPTYDNLINIYEYLWRYNNFCVCDFNQIMNITTFGGNVETAVMLTTHKLSRM